MFLKPILILLKPIFIFLCICGMLFSTFFSMGASKPVNDLFIIMNMPDVEQLPRNFRTTEKPHDSLQNIQYFNKTQKTSPSTVGLSKLRASASGQFSEKSLQKILKTVPAHELILIDLREEYHGFINGIAISWFTEKNWSNRDKSLEQILFEEKQLFEKIKKTKFLTLYAKNTDLHPLTVPVNEAYTEKELADAKGIQYVRIPTTDHLKPIAGEVDRFIQFVKANSLSKDPHHYWLHFHCAAGRGRSTTFLSMYDMMNNASNVSFEDILARQAMIGGKDLTQPFELSDWRYEHHFERLQFLKDFYIYCLENPNFEQSWSEWTKNNH